MVAWKISFSVLFNGSNSKAKTQVNSQSKKRSESLHFWKFLLDPL